MYSIFFLRDAESFEIMTSAMRDIVDSNFIGENDADGSPLPFEPGQIPKMKIESFETSLHPIKLEGTAEDEWMFRQIIHRGNLIAKGCRVVSLLAKSPQSVQRNCFDLGKYLYLTWQAYVDFETFKSESFQPGEKLNLTSAPVLFHLQHEPSLHAAILKQSKTSEGVDYQTVYHEVLNGPGLQETKKLLNKLKKNTRKYLTNFESSEENNKIKLILKDFH
jgi:decaprenyl-diphosphate synthase subunit 2